jgi:hypothetical protein
VLELHIIPAIMPQKLLKQDATIKSFAGFDLTVAEGGSNPSITAGGAIASVTNPDILTCKGIVHVISRVLVAPEMFAHAQLETPEASIPEASTPAPVPAPVPAPPPGRPNHSNGVKPGPDGKWSVCAGSWGPLSGDEPCGVRASKTGKVTIVRVDHSCVMPAGK